MIDPLILDVAKQLANERGYSWDVVPEDEDGCQPATRTDYINDARAAILVVLSHFAQPGNVTKEMLAAANEHGDLPFIPDEDISAGIAGAMEAEMNRRQSLDANAAALASYQAHRA